MNLKSRIKALEKLERKKGPQEVEMRVVESEEEADKVEKELQAQGKKGLIVIVESEEAKELTERVLKGERT